ncbi:MAG: ABC transporter substrate-binding protein [Magnetospirillum sp.]|nr:ABC transporter substrate-binding protein [Magnetospirillum sp.]
MLSRRLMILATLAGSLFLAAARPAHAEDSGNPKQFVSNLADDAITLMTSSGLNDAQRNDQFRKLFVGSVDLPVVGKLVLARYWRIATPQQQQEFLKLFEDMLVLTWSNRFKDAAGNVTFHVVDVRPDVDQGVLVDSQILREKQQPIPLIWRLRQTDGNWHIIDLIVEGTSMVFTYREEYASVITQNGGKVEGLLNAMRRKVAQLSQSRPGAAAP